MHGIETAKMKMQGLAWPVTCYSNTHQYGSRLVCGSCSLCMKLVDYHRISDSVAAIEMIKSHPL